MTTILGIDPGSQVTGYGLIDSDGVRSRHLCSGCIRTRNKVFVERLGEIYLGVRDLIAEFAPDEVAVEQVFVANNPASALKLGQARGAAVTAAVVAALPVFEYSPRSVKSSLVGTGKAEKEQVQHMVRVILNLQGRMALDASDALAVALCHAHSQATLKRLGGVR